MSWALYDELIDGIPEDVLVKDYCLGLNWSYVEAECGMGVSYTVRGGATESTDRRNFVGLPLRDVAALSKSWRFEEATLGVAALNAWYCQPERIDPLGARYDKPKTSGAEGETAPTNQRPRGRRDAFAVMRPRIETTPNAKVVVVGHFPHLERIKEYAQLTVLERNCRTELDTPDSACEFVLPEADFAFITGITLTNKTLPRLLELSRNAHVSLVGPSVVMCQAMLDAGVDLAAGRVVIDPERARASVRSGGALSFAGSLKMATIEKQA